MCLLSNKISLVFTQVKHRVCDTLTPVSFNSRWKMYWNYCSLLQTLQWFVLGLEGWWWCLLFEFIITLFNTYRFLGTTMFSYYGQSCYGQNVLRKFSNENFIWLQFHKFWIIFSVSWQELKNSVCFYVVLWKEAKTTSLVQFSTRRYCKWKEGAVYRNQYTLSAVVEVKE